MRGLSENWFKTFGYPKRIHTDNDRSFGSEEFLKFCKERDIGLSKTGIYGHHQNGHVERLHRWLREQIQILRISGEDDWVKACSILQLRYNTGWNASIAEVPYYVVFGRETNAVREMEKKTLKKVTSKRVWNMLMETIGNKRREKSQLVKGKLNKEVKVGDCVWHMAKDAGTKFDQDYGPWRVQEFVGNNVLKARHVLKGTMANLDLENCGLASWVLDEDDDSNK